MTSTWAYMYAWNMKLFLFKNIEWNVFRNNKIKDETCLEDIVDSNTDFFLYNHMINGPCFLMVFIFKIKILLAFNIWFFSIEFIFPSYVTKMLSKGTVVLIESNNICINHTHSWPWRGCSLGAYASEFPEPTGACSRPAGAWSKACMSYTCSFKCKSSAVVDTAVPCPSYLEWLKLSNLQ